MISLSVLFQFLLATFLVGMWIVDIKIYANSDLFNKMPGTSRE